MATYRVLWTQSARADLESIVDFIAEESPRAAIRILDRLDKRARTLQQFPERGRIVSELRAIDVFLYRELIQKPWRIIYRINGNRVYIMAVLDARRDLASLLLERLVR